MTGNLQESEDIAQETFLTAWKQLGNLRESEKIGPWLCGIARMLCKRWFDSNHHDPLHKAASIDQHDFEPQPPEETLREKRQEQANLAWAAIADVPQQFREPLVLYYREGRSVREVAETLELTESCVKQRLHRGRQFLKQELERLVETALETTRPGEFFTVAVLAAIPILATGPQALAAGSAGAAAAQSASSGGAGAGQSLFAGIATFCRTFIYNLAPFLVVFIGTLLGAWSLVRHAPTRAARRFMIKSVLEYCAIFSGFVLCYYFYIFYVQRYLIRSQYYDRFDYLKYHHWYEYLCYFCVALVPVLIILNTIRINRRWRQVIEYDSGMSPRKPKETTWKSILSLFGIALFFNIVFIAWFVYIWYFHMPSGHPMSWMQWFMLLSVPTALTAFLYCGWKISRDEVAFQKAPPRLPNLLQILTGEQPYPKGFRNQIYFWGDLTFIGLGMFIMQMCYIGWYLWFTGIPDMSLFGFSIGNGCYFSLVLSILAYMIFVLFFAGVPRRRYWGMIFLAGTIFVINAFMICYSQLWLYVKPFEFAVVFGLHFWYTLCFALFGVAGLLTFRKKSNFV